ncbi:MAG: hypothetical protein ACYDDO_07385 [Acidiferrobacterales bacterium]
MNILTQTADTLSLVLEPGEARSLLEGLREGQSMLGEPAETLSKLLTAAGVLVPEPAGPERTEYMPPQ